MDECSISCKGVVENGPGANYGTEDLGLSAFLAGRGWGALLTCAEPAQQGECVEACGVAALKGNLNRVLTDQGHVLDPKFFRGQALYAGEAAWSSGFAAALGARAIPSELFAGVGAAVAVLPRDLHHLALTVDVDG